jgi:hypothetical protein
MMGFGLGSLILVRCPFVSSPLFVLFRVISWIFFERSRQDDPRNHTKQHETYYSPQADTNDGLLTTDH